MVRTAAARALLPLSASLVALGASAQTQNPPNAVGKARSAALYKRPTKALQDALAAGGNGLRILALEGAVPVEGGLPLLHEGKLVGAIGVSGDTSEHDGQCAQAGVQALGAATAQR